MVCFICIIEALLLGTGVGVSIVGNLLIGTVMTAASASFLIFTIKREESCKVCKTEGGV